MPIDIYTRQLITTPSEEHILPQALGGKLFSRELIDKTTNDGFGCGIDARLDEALRPIRLPIDARSARGKSPRSAHRVHGSDGNEYLVDPGGKVSPLPRGKFTRLPDGTLQFEGSAPDARSLKQMLRKELRGKNVDLDAIVFRAMAEGRHRRAPIPGLRFPFHLWQDDPYRATAKIAFNLFAFTEPKMALSPAFDEVRQYILNGRVPSIDPVQAGPAQPEEGIGQLDHLVLLEIPPTGAVVASVTYFRHLRFVVRLGIATGASAKRASYRVDQLGGQDRRNDPRDLAISTSPFQLENAPSGDALRELATDQLAPLIVAVERIQQQNLVQRIVEQHWHALVRESGEEKGFSFELRLRFVDDLVKHLREEMGPRFEQEGRSLTEFEENLRANLIAALAHIAMGSPQ